MRAEFLSAERASLSMDAGPRLSDERAGSLRSALAVPLDDVTGYVVAAGAPEGRWPVSLGIRVDFLRDPPSQGRPMRITGDLIERDGRGGTTRGDVFDADGRRIAIVVQRSHLVSVPTRPTSRVHQPARPPESVSLRGALEIAEPAPGLVVMPPIPLAANGMDNVHGGILLCGAEFAAMSSIDARGDWRATSVDINYLRPVSALDTTTFAADVVHRGRSTAVVRVLVSTAIGKAGAIATVTLQHGS
ncbi:PaaI family thioesterase [Gordonia terrae]|uniref:PaaI family thioesterase n=1 Tax=Gordonia terrae TaxID=2055 RepID=UPI00200B0153|nr:PaaI family thioesterase [Gordonia terrae]UPW08505.1 PaaI family thioesterase [Gordonia terrae]